MFSTNHQNKPIFFIVVKDANRQMYICNISILLSEKKWFFKEIISTTFILLYGLEAIQHNQLILIDEESEEYEPVKNAINTTKARAKSTYMFSVFHALRKVQEVGISQTTLCKVQSQSFQTRS